jgi:hypothetical protein
MNHIVFDLRLVKADADESDARDYLALGIRVDGRDLLEFVREIEAPFAAAEGHPDLAGHYEPLPAEMALSHLTGDRAEKVSLFDCECCCFGCWPLLVQISKADDTITWSDFEQPHRGPKSRASWWRYDKLGPFKFDREQYLAAIAKAANELR